MTRQNWQRGAAPPRRNLQQGNDGGNNNTNNSYNNTSGVRWAQGQAAATSNRNIQEAIFENRNEYRIENIENE